MTRQVTDNLYIELDYFTPEEYYTYEAVAQSALAAESTFACDANVIAGGEIVIASGDLPAFATLTVTISHLEGSDMFAFAEAALAAAVDRIRDNNIAATAVFDIATDGRVFRDLAAAPTSLFDFDVVNERSREFNLDAQAAFSLAADNTRLKLFGSDLTTTSEIFCVISHIEGADIVAFQNSQVTVSANVVRDANSNQSGVFSLNSVIGVKTNAESTVLSAFTVTAIVQRASRSVGVPTIFSGQVGQFNHGTLAFDSSVKKFTTSVRFDGRDGWFNNPTTNMVWTGTEFVLVSWSGNTTKKTYKSPDGISWTVSNNNLPEQLGGGTNRLFYVNSKFHVFHGSSANAEIKAAESTDGITWTAYDAIPPSGISGQNRVTNFTYNSIRNRYYISSTMFRTTSDIRAQGYLSNVGVFDAYNLVFSHGGGSQGQTSMNDSVTTNVGFVGVSSGPQSFNNRIFVSSTTSGTGAVNSSPAGQTGFNGIAYNGNNTTVIVGNGGKIFRSSSTDSNLTNYLNSFGSISVFPTTNDFLAVSFANGQFMVSGKGGVVLTSTTGQEGTWTARTTNVTHDLYGRPKFVGNNTWIIEYATTYNLNQTSTLGYIRSTDNGVSWSDFNFNQVLPSAKISYPDHLGYASWKTLDFWAQTTQITQFNSFRIGQESDWYIELLSISSSGTRFDFVVDGVVQATSTNSVLAPHGLFNHYRVAYNGSQLSLYLNGNRVANASLPGLDFASTSNLEFKYRNNRPYYNTFIDEFQITDDLLVDPSQTSFTVPTSEYANDYNTRLLLHFNGTYEDDASELPRIRIFDSQLTTAFTQTAAANRTRDLLSNQNSEFTIFALGSRSTDIDLVAFANAAVSVNADKIRQFQSNIVSQSTVVADVTDIKGIVSDILAETTLTAELTEIVGEVVEAIGDWSSTVLFETTPTRIRSLASSLSVDSQQTAVVWRILDFTIETQSLFSPSINVVVQRDSEIALVSQTALTGVILRIRSSSADMLSVSAQSSVIGVVKQFAADAGALFTPNVQVDVIVNPFAQFETTTSLVTSVEIIADVISDQTAESTLSSEVSVTKGFQANANSTLTQLTSAQRFRNTDSSISSVADISVVAVKAFGSNTALSSAFDQSATVTRIQPAASDLNSNFEIEASVARTRDDSAIISSKSTQAVDYIRFRDTNSTQSSEFTQSATAFRIQTGASDLVATSMLVADAVKTTDVLVSATAVTTFNAQAVKTVDVLPVLDSIATSLIVAAKNATGTITLESAFASTALIGKIQQGRTDSTPLGITFAPKSNPIAPILYLEPLAATDSTGRFVMSFYLSKDTVGAIFNGNIGFESGAGAFVGITYTDDIPPTFSGGPFRYRLSYSGNNAASQVYPRVDWIINYTQDQDYHHHLLLVNLNENNVEDMYQLYVDGQKQYIEYIVREYASESVRIPMTIGNTLSGEPVGMTLGSVLDRNVGRYNNERKISSRDPNDNGSLLQFWFDYNFSYPTNTSEFRRKFYPGKYVDLGADGTATGLPQPKYYVGLKNYQDTLEQGTRTTNPLTNWRWAQLEGFGTTSGTGISGYSSLAEFNATEAQNSTLANKNIVAVTEMTVTLLGVILNVADLNSTTALTAEGTLVKGLIADLLAETAQSAQAAKTTDVISTQVSEFQQTADVGRFREIPSTLTSEFDLTASVRFETKFEIDLFSEFTILAGVGEQQEFASDLVSEFVFDATTTIIDPIRSEADLVSDSQLSATVVRIHPGTGSIDSEFALAADVTLIPPIRIEADLASEFSLQVDALAIVNNSSALSSEFTQSANVSVTVGIITEVQAQSTLEAEAFKATGIGLTNLQVTAFTLTVGDVINFDPFLTLRVEQETRGLIIDPENRVVSIEQETRLNIIQGS